LIRFAHRDARPGTVISIVIPAYNEELLLGAAIVALRDAGGALQEPFEIIVADDGSTDRTAEVARAHGAIVVSATRRHIGATRNAGARAASGDLLVFVDADTIVPRDVLLAAVAAMREGHAVGGGAAARFDSNDPWWGPPILVFVSWLMRVCGWAAGCFFFVRRDAFERVGGFDERYFASEEIHLSGALKKQGRFVILRQQVITSARKGRLFSLGRVTAQFARMLLPGTPKRRDRLDMWYGGDREKDRK
jgi:glycosyltransferase involved in cell wall biosynthesis